MFLENCVDYSLSLPENVFDGCVGISQSVFHEILDLVDKVSHNRNEDGEKRKNQTYKQKKCSDKIQLFVCLYFLKAYPTNDQLNFIFRTHPATLTRWIKRILTI